MFLDVAEPAKKAIGAEAVESQAEACLDLATLHKGFGSLRKAETYCGKALEIRKTAANAADLLGCHLALAGTLVLQFDREAETETEVKAALDLAAPDTHEKCEARHLRALLNFTRYERNKLNAADKDADKTAENEWRDLLTLQQQRNWKMEEVRTHYYLSQLAYLRWQRHVGELRNYKDAVDKYNRDVNKYKKDKNSYDGEVAKYNLKKAAWELAEPEKNQADTAVLDSEWDRLQGLYSALSMEKHRLLNQKESLNMKFEGVKGAYEAIHAARTGGLPSSREKSPAPSLLAKAQESAETSAELLDLCKLYPSLHYLVLCHLAEVLRACAASEPGTGAKDLQTRQESLLKDAVNFLELPRASFAEEDVARAEFFAQYYAAFDQLIDASLKTNPEEALVYAELCRNRVFLDRVCADGYQPATSLAAEDQHLAEDAEKQANQIAKLGKQIRLAVGTTGAGDVGQARKEIKGAYEKYAEAQHAILRKSSLGNATVGCIVDREDVRATVKRWSQAEQPMLYYHVGIAKCYLFVLGIEHRVRAFTIHGDPGNGMAANVPAGTVIEWVEHYRNLISKRDPITRQGRFTLSTAAEKDQCVKIANCLLPPEVRTILKQALSKRPDPTGESSTLIVSPDGALLQLPFEALVLKNNGDRGQTFLIDDLPQKTGIVYAPSLMILDVLKRRAAAAGPRGVLTVGCCDFSGFQTTRHPQLAALPKLNSALSECKNVAGIFLSRSPLLDDQATEKQFREAVVRDRPACIHVATHAVLLDEAKANAEAEVNGPSALVLCPGPAGATSNNDGLLEIEEIYGLPLRGCELAVLSACHTNAGRDMPREMPLTLSRAFFAAGARRVVASQWNVADDAAGEFIPKFLKEVARAWQSPTPCDYALAIRKARQEVRNRAKWSDPFYWSSFVLIGPAGDCVPAANEKETE